MDPIYSGSHLKELAKYLSPRRRSSQKAQKSYVPPQGPCLFVYDASDFSSLSSFESSETFVQLTDDDDVLEGNRVVLLAGHASPEWLTAVGAEFNLDPCFLMTHLSFRPSAKAQTYALPPIPNVNSGIICLTVPTIGHVEPERTPLRSEDLQSLRRQCTQRLRDCQRTAEFSGGSGRALVRRFALHDTNRFTLEQDITISLVRTEDSWKGMCFSPKPLRDASCTCGQDLH